MLFIEQQLIKEGIIVRSGLYELQTIIDKIKRNKKLHAGQSLQRS